MQIKRFAASVAVAVLFAAPAAAQEAPPAVQQAAEVEPAPPANAPASYVLPPRGADGRWRTPNAGIGTEEAAWHLRVALNVAALGCRDAAEAQTVAGYNALLADRKAALATAAAASEAAFRARYGEAWRAAHDDAMTRLYNFWAQPPVQAAFCTEARAVLAEQAMVEPSSFAAWTAASLERLEAPFIAFYTAFDGYRTELAAYRARHAAPVMTAGATTPAFTPANAPVQVAAVSTTVAFPVP